MSDLNSVLGLTQIPAALASIDEKLAAVLVLLDKNAFDLVRLSEARDRLGVSDLTLRKWEQEYGFSGIYKRDRCHFVSKAELEKFLKQKGPK